MAEHSGVVLHIAQGTYRGTIAWQMNPDQRYADGTPVNTSSTWVVGREPGEWAQMVDTDLIAWCQRDGSRRWLSAELAGFAPSAPTGWQIEACAQLLAWAHRHYGIPLAVADHPGERGLGHHSMDREWAPYGEEWGHEACPGTGVINAKAAIVARAQTIVAGEDDIPVDQKTFNGLLAKAYEDPTVAGALGNAIKNIRTGMSPTSPAGSTFAQLLLDAADESDVPTARPTDPAAIAAAIVDQLPARDARAVADAVVSSLAARLADPA